jgi:hypothetical protein
MPVVDLGYKPRPWQAEVHNNLKRFSVLVVHRRGGKTVLAIMALIGAAVRSAPNRARFAYLAPQLKQAKAVAWDYLKHYASKVNGCEINESETWVQFANGARIRIYGADNPDSLRGIYLDGCVLDEVADLKPEVWGEILRPALSDRKGWALFIGTPKGVNLFSELYYAALKDPEWFAKSYDVYQTQAIDPTELMLMKSGATGMTENQFRQEMLCDFSASVENQLITVDRVLAASGKHLREDEYEGSPIILGVDVARYGDDRSVIFRRQGLAAFKPLVFSGMDNMELASRVVQEIEHWSPDAVFIDAGRGEGVIDRLRMLGHRVIAIDFGGKSSTPTIKNKRAEMWFNLSEWLKMGGALPDMAELKADLCAPTYSYANEKNIFELESKDDLKARGLRSPDIADALALTFAMPVAPRRLGFDARKPAFCTTEVQDE